MIAIVAKNPIKPECAEAFKAAASKLAEASRKEEGCLFYALFEDVKQPNSFTFIEQWKDQEAISKHNASPHFVSIVPTFSRYLSGESEVSIYKEAL
ncbi:MAG: antibiotic biosynthesis monooxygenase [Clostridiales bacterium]|nr:antibiotic biosynthesis monooxygenase [Clostridiales bacterium]